MRYRESAGGEPPAFNEDSVVRGGEDGPARAL
jgi:hypothetical protein